MIINNTIPTMILKESILGLLFYLIFYFLKAVIFCDAFGARRRSDFYPLDPTPYGDISNECVICFS